MYIEVILPLKLKKTYCYNAREDVKLGSFVKVDFNNKIVIAIVYKISEHKLYDKIKDVLELLPLPCLSESQIQFFKWISDYNLMPIGLVLKMSLVKKMLPEKFYTLNKNIATKKYKKIFQSLLNYKTINKNNSCFSYNIVINYFEIIDCCKIRENTLQNLIDENIITEIKYDIVDEKFNDNIVLTELQYCAYKKILIHKDHFSVHLLDGITGSGKTEVYLKIIVNILKEPGSQALIMVPEIGLTTQTLERFQKYFGNLVEILQWHSNIKLNKRCYNWQKILYGRAKIIIGARSALFLPYKNLKILVVDEEHDSSYKDDQGEFSYNARDMAIVKAKILNIPIILSSATPSIETIVNALNNKFFHISIHERYAGAVLPDVKLIDMCSQKKINDYISEELFCEIKKTITLNKQVLLFFNRRGYAPIVMCTACGKKIGCPNCSLWLIQHKNLNILQCHMCGFKKKYLSICPSCNIKDKLITYGLGVEQIQEEIAKLFVQEKILVLSSDNNNINSDIIDIINNKYNIIVGTQIASKGYNFPHLRLVGIIDADHNFYGGDLRASERTFQLITQVMGRSGRSVENKGIVVLQTYNPKSNLISAIVNYDKNAFYEAELKNRKDANMPPFTRLISVTFSYKKEDILVIFIKNITKLLKKDENVNIFGPNKAPIYYCKKYYRYKFLFISSKNFDIHNYIKKWLDDMGNLGKIKTQIDVDPINFL